MFNGQITTMTPLARRLPPSCNDLPARLTAAGFAPDVAEALAALDAEMFVAQRRAVKGELPARLIAEAGLDLDFGAFTALTAILRITNGVGRAQAEPATVGLLADELSIDPSRASRVASGLIEAGWVRRDVAQDDGRKSILVLTDRAQAAFSQFRDLKWSKLAEVFADWSGDDIRTFARLFARYSDGVERVYRPET